MTFFQPIYKIISWLNKSRNITSYYFSIYVHVSIFLVQGCAILNNDRKDDIKSKKKYVQ